MMVLTLPFRFKRQDKIEWECAHGGQVWSDSVAAANASSTTIPGGFCATGFSSLNVAFIAGLSIDLVFQVRNYKGVTGRCTLFFDSGFLIRAPA